MRLGREDRPPPRAREIEAVIAAYNAADPEMLPPEAVQLLTVMFRRSRVCQRSLVDLAAEVSDPPRAVDRLLRFLTAIGFLSTEHSPRRIASTYRLHLPPTAQP
jgi:hypothetical protein